METEKEKRSEYASVWVTPTVKKELERVDNNSKMQEEIIRMYLSSEKNWLEQELKEIDEATIRYSAKLIGIKDAFEKVQDAYTIEIENLYQKTADAQRKIDEPIKKVNQQLDEIKNKVYDINSLISKFDLYKIESLLSLTDRLRNLSASEIALMKLALEKS